MQGVEEFKLIFGGVTLWQVVELGLAIGFTLTIYRKVKNFIIERHDAEQERDEKLATALDSISKYPEYRAQSLKIQDELRGEIAELRSSQQQTAQRLQKMDEEQRTLKRNELRDRLLEAYRYYTSKGAWNIMEADVFWELFRDYEKLGGDGFVHGTIEPAMRRCRCRRFPLRGIPTKNRKKAGILTFFACSLTKTPKIRE